MDEAIESDHQKLVIFPEDWCAFIVAKGGGAVEMADFRHSGKLARLLQFPWHGTGKAGATKGDFK